MGRVERMEQSSSRAVPHAFERTDTSGDETEGSEPRKRFLSKRTYKKKDMWGADELGCFSVTGATSVSGKTRHFYRQICRKDVFVNTHAVQEILRHFQGTQHFPRDQSLRLENPVWRVLGFEGNPMKEEEVERQRERIMKAPQLVRHREDPFSEDLIEDSSGAVDVSLFVLGKVSALIEELGLGGSYELVNQLRYQFTLFAAKVNVDVTWSRDEVLVSALLVPCFMCSSWLFIVLLLLVNHSKRHVPPES